jgi:hypothetical protein
MIQKITALYTVFYVRWIILPTLLFLFSFIILILNILFHDFSPSVLSFNHNSRTDFKTEFKNIKNGDELTGSFKAVENNLGILSLQFKSLSPVKGTLQFTLFDDNNTKLAYNEYDTRQLYYLSEYPFGFPIIENSKGKTYHFKIAFLADNKDAQEALKINESNLITKYKFDSKKIISEPELLFNFIFKKIVFTLSLVGQTKFYVLYFLPLLLLLLVNVTFHLKIISQEKFQKFFTKLKKSKYIFFIKKRLLHEYPVFLLAHAIYVLFFPFESTLLAVIIVLVWSTYLYRFKLDASSTFVHCALFSTLLVPLVVFGFSEMIIKALVLLFFFLVIGLAQSIIEIKLDNVKT